MAQTQDMALFGKAVRFATDAHEGMVRKAGNTPYILHPMEVAAIAATMTDDIEVLAAALLHDVVEDTDHSLHEIERQFGERVASLVASETEDKRHDMPPSDSWRMRKEESLADLEHASRDAKIVWLSDKLSNMRSFYRSYLVRGDELWTSFNQSDPAQQAWYYTSVASLCSELSETAAWREYDQLVRFVFAKELS